MNKNNSIIIVLVLLVMTSLLIFSFSFMVPFFFSNFHTTNGLTLTPPMPTRSSWASSADEHLGALVDHERGTGVLFPQASARCIFHSPYPSVLLVLRQS